jgi:hypothetical protein
VIDAERKPISAEKEPQNQLQMSSTLSMQQSRDLAGNSESAAAGSIEITPINSSSDQGIHIATCSLTLLGDN